jgi:hypothetical protein
MIPRTGYRLPFPTSVSPGLLLSKGQAIEIEGTLTRIPADPAQGIAAWHTFVRLAETGALAGESIRPDLSWITAEALRTDLASFGATCTACAVDESAAIVISQMFAACGEAFPVSRLTLAGPGSPAVRPIESAGDGSSDYPMIFKPLPFTWEDERSQGDCMGILAEFVSPLSTASAARLEADLNSWAAVVLAGGYALPPIPPGNSHLEVSEGAFAVYGSTVEWGFCKLRADPASVDGLVNLFTAFHRRIQPLTLLRFT